MTTEEIQKVKENLEKLANELRNGKATKSLTEMHFENRIIGDVPTLEELKDWRETLVKIRLEEKSDPMKIMVLEMEIHGLSELLKKVSSIQEKVEKAKRNFGMNAGMQNAVRNLNLERKKIPETSIETVKEWLTELVDDVKAKRWSKSLSERYFSQGGRSISQTPTIEEMETWVEILTTCGITESGSDDVRITILEVEKVSMKRAIEKMKEVDQLKELLDESKRKISEKKEEDAVKNLINGIEGITLN